MGEILKTYTPLKTFVIGVHWFHHTQTRMFCNAHIHTYILYPYNMILYCASDLQLIQVKFQIQIPVVGGLGKHIASQWWKPTFPSIQNMQRFPSHLLWAATGEFFDFVIRSSSGVLYKSLSEWNNCQLPVFEILRRTSKGPLVKVGSFRLVLWFFKNSISQGSICMTLMHWFLLWNRENCVGLWASACFEALVGWAYSLYKVW